MDKQVSKHELEKNVVSENQWVISNSAKTTSGDSPSYMLNWKHLNQLVCKFNLIKE